MNFLARLYSRLKGRRIGETQFVQAVPFITGPIGCLLPTDCWTETEKSQVRLRYHEYTWNGWNWVFKGTIERKLRPEQLETT